MQSRAIGATAGNSPVGVLTATPGALEVLHLGPGTRMKVEAVGGKTGGRGQKERENQIGVGSL